MTPSAPDLAARVPPVALLVAFSVLGPVTLHMILPSLPILEAQFGSDYATTQLLVSVFVLAFGAGQVLVGPLGDVLGRRTVLCGGMALFAAASALCALAPRIEVLIGLRVLQGLGACTGTVLARAIIRDHHEAPASTRILGHLAMGIAIGPIVAPTLGGVLFEAGGWRLPFAVLAALGVANAALALLLLPAAPRPSGGAGALRRLGSDLTRLVRDRGFLHGWLSVCFNAGTAFTFMACAPLLADRALGLSPTLFGLWFGLGAVGYIAGNFLAGRLSERLPGRRMLAWGTLGVAAAAALLLLALLGATRSPLLVFGLFGLVMAASGLVMPNAFAGAMAAVPEAAGSASGFVGLAQFVMGAAFAAVAGHLADMQGEPAWVGAVMLLSALCGVGVALSPLGAARA